MSAPRLTAEVTLDVDRDTARALHGALSPETERPVPGTVAEVAVRGADGGGVGDGDAGGAGDGDVPGLALRIEADGASSMRAALNSLLRFAHTALEVQALDGDVEDDADVGNDAEVGNDADAPPTPKEA